MNPLNRLPLLRRREFSQVESLVLHFDLACVAQLELIVCLDADRRQQRDSHQHKEPCQESHFSSCPNPDGRTWWQRCRLCLYGQRAGDDDVAIVQFAPNCDTRAGQAPRRIELFHANLRADPCKIRMLRYQSVSIEENLVTAVMWLATSVAGWPGGGENCLPSRHG